jgi:hypothetical protein
MFQHGTYRDWMTPQSRGPVGGTCSGQGISQALHSERTSEENHQRLIWGCICENRILSCPTAAPGPASDVDAACGAGSSISGQRVLTWIAGECADREGADSGSVRLRNTPCDGLVWYPQRVVIVPFSTPRSFARRSGSLPGWSARVPAGDGSAGGAADLPKGIPPMMRCRAGNGMVPMRALPSRRVACRRHKVAKMGSSMPDRNAGDR